jgi:CheY-like chemotaxis protein
MDAVDRVPRLRGLSILAAEDNENNQLVLEYMLKTEGAVPTFAYNGAELLEILQVRGPEAFDIVLMDIQMPVMDGYEAAQKVRSLAPGLPIVGLTAHAMSEARDKCLAAGMVEHVAKPIDLDQLVQVILKYVGVASPRGFEPRSQP